MEREDEEIFHLLKAIFTRRGLERAIALYRRGFVGKATFHMQGGKALALEVSEKEKLTEQR